MVKGSDSNVLVLGLVSSTRSFPVLTRAASFNGHQFHVQLQLTHVDALSTGPEQAGGQIGSHLWSHPHPQAAQQEEARGSFASHATLHEEMTPMLDARRPFRNQEKKVVSCAFWSPQVSVVQLRLGVGRRALAGGSRPLDFWL